MITLKQYIKENHQSQADFARSLGICRAQLNYWVKKDYLVKDFNGELWLMKKARKIKGGE